MSFRSLPGRAKCPTRRPSRLSSGRSSMFSQADQGQGALLREFYKQLLDLASEKCPRSAAGRRRSLIVQIHPDFSARLR